MSFLGALIKIRLQQKLSWLKQILPSSWNFNKNNSVSLSKKGNLSSMDLPICLLIILLTISLITGCQDASSTVQQPTQKTSTESTSDRTETRSIFKNTSLEQAK